MYYKNRSNQLSADMGAMLNRENAAETLAAGDIVKMAESLPRAGVTPKGGRPPQGQLGSKGGDIALMQAMYTGVAKKLLPYVKKAVRDNMYSGSPGLRPVGPDRAFADKVTDDVIAAARTDMDEADEICLDKVCEGWNDKRLLYDLAHTMVLTEMFLRYRCGKALQ